jgi:hypothetical protein
MYNNSLLFNLYLQRLETALGAGTLLGRTPCSVAGHAALFVLLVAIAPIDYDN